MLFTPDLERALRWAFARHEGQHRRGCGAPYAEHPTAVAMILDRLGFEEEVVVAGLLHDVVEDTDATLDDVRSRFGPTVAGIVAHCSEVKLDAEGRKRPWIDRKRDHLAALADAPTAARAVVLADKLHNLLSIRLDLDEGRPVWADFHAPRDRVLGYYAATVEALGRDDARLETLAAECRRLLAAIDHDAASAVENRGEGPPAG